MVYQHRSTTTVVAMSESTTCKSQKLLQVTIQDRTSENTILKFMTDGMLLREATELTAYVIARDITENRTDMTTAPLSTLVEGKMVF
eukprot:3987127-Amphidinium_carterae.1